MQNEYAFSLVPPVRSAFKTISTPKVFMKKHLQMNKIYACSDFLKAQYITVQSTDKKINQQSN